MKIPTVTSVRFLRAGRAHARNGLLGWLSFALDDAVLVDGVTLRRTVKGDLRLAYPQRRSRTRGMRHPIVRPLAEEVRAGIEAQVFAAIAGELEL